MLTMIQIQDPTSRRAYLRRLPLLLLVRCEKVHRIIDCIEADGDLRFLTVPL
jgi:hypothetical protein